MGEDYIFLLTLLVGATIAGVQTFLVGLPPGMAQRIACSLLVGGLVGYVSWLLDFDEARTILGGATFGYWLVACIFRTDDP